MTHANHGGFSHPFSAYRPKPDGDKDPAGEAGWFLQRERERRGLSYAQVAEVTGIHPHHLEAIELGDLTRMPPRVEALKMVSQYAESLGFDPQPLVLHYAQFLPRPLQAIPGEGTMARPLGSAKIISFQLAQRLRSFPDGAGGIVASVFGAVLLFGGLSYALAPVPEKHAVAGVLLDEQADRMEGVSYENAATTVASISSLSEEPLDDVVAASRPAIEPAGGPEEGLGGLTALIERELAIPAGPVPAGSEPTIAELIPAVETMVVPRGGSRVYGAENKDSRLLLKATAPVWIRIEDGSGRVVLTQTLGAGDSYRVPNRSGLVAIARDGGLITYEVDGVDHGSLGAPGEILVGRSLDLKRLADDADG